MRATNKLHYAALLSGVFWSAAVLAEGPGPIIVNAPTTTSFDQPSDVDKLGTAIGDIPRSIQIIPRALADEQGATQVRDVLRDVSGLTQGGQFAFGFYDRFNLRGLNVSFLSDGLPDGTSDLGGYVHSLTGVERVEVLKGPGSALYGALEPGGTINLVHARPSDAFSASVGEQYGSYDTTTTTASINGKLADGIDGRIDGEYQHSDGFRGQRGKTAELYGSMGFHPADHDILARLEYHRIEATPDSLGLPFAPSGKPALPFGLPRETRLYTPFAFADQTIKRAFLSDAWTVDDHLIVHLRGAYTDRDVDLARNGGGKLTAAGATYSFNGRQLRKQSDHIHDFVFLAEPTWTFATGSISHVLLTGADVRRVSGHTQRSTADLPVIADVHDPVIPETSLAALDFLCDAGHSCNDADLDATFYGLYAIDQIGFGDRLKIRLSARQNWFETRAEGRSAIPRNPGSEHVCNPPQTTTCAYIPGELVKRNDQTFSWDVGAVYSVTPGLSLFSGYSSAAYPIFNTEEPQSVGQVPEKGTQIEAGLRAQQGSWLSLSTSLFRTTRRNVFTILLVDGLDVPQVFSYRTKGWETDLNLRPTSRWTILGNLTLQNARLTDYPQNPGQIGNHVPTVPWMLANAWTSYDLPLPDALGKLQLAGGVRYREHEYTDAGQTRLLPHATAVDLSAAWVRDRWTLRGGIQNLFDRTNYAYSAGTGSGAIPDQGRTVFVSFVLKAF